MIDGPYGGSTIDASAFETVLFVSGGSGRTFTMGLLDELVEMPEEKSSRHTKNRICMVHPQNVYVIG